MGKLERLDTDPFLSVVLISYNMKRELPRTLHSLSTGMQKGISPGAYEIIVVDNGSTDGFDDRACLSVEAEVKVIQIKEASQSPASAINKGVDSAAGELIGVMIDGARLASPGLLCNAILAARLHRRPVISTLSFHLGHEAQYISRKKGYDQQVEDQLLESVKWTKDGYRLFDVSAFAASSDKGWFVPVTESNALFLRREMWEELGGFDERFVSPGGGLVNHDTYLRACELPDSQPIVLLGEGTFHQIHREALKAAKGRSPFEEYHDEYLRIRGKPLKRPESVQWYVGTVPPQALRWIQARAGEGVNGESWASFRKLKDSLRQIMKVPSRLLENWKRLSR